MTRKKKIMVIVFSILGAVIIALSTVLAAAAIMGRPLKSQPVTQIGRRKRRYSKCAVVFFYRG